MPDADEQARLRDLARRDLQSPSSGLNVPVVGEDTAGRSAAALDRYEQAGGGPQTNSAGTVPR